ncbi:hypothetical protein NZD89_08675 [Alicyclobacillus fastidiosus]|uniref:Uncharacterized protein n=1 Tax=Alicyclobacillus fastidiosus TaxID=392011 RepID=A0ABY6ZKQ0_9BACL|nr:hypothetical protein [Alicyclobacillus fastidiosus]WAH43441.1 hypothetical protein NZD89_08675 [Alicyclobacillus fastidiosus]GMA59594.1 hypothetical protein GCM10025859_00340 [Alicyclobacillus fastidiosus]GMA65521.1 hypothetical protein GCM10025859_59610 [Alicyclobacillus fastidiosus]
MTFNYEKAFPLTRHELCLGLAYLAGIMLSSFFIGIVISMPMPKELRKIARIFISLVCFIGTMFYLLYHPSSIVRI